MSLWNRLRDLSLDVTALRIAELRMPSGGSWVRRTRLIELSGGGHAGAGEDVSWVEVSPAEILALYPEDLLVFRGSLAEWCQRLDAREATPAYQSLATGRQSEPDYLRWALESAAVELALRQNSTNLAALWNLQPAPMRFCLSMGLGEPPSVSTVAEWCSHGAYRFKIDAASSWTDETVAALQELNCVAVVDLKNYYKGTTVDQDPDAVLLARVASGLPHALLEDALPNEETLPILEPHRARVTWDAPIHSVADIDRVKPSSWPTPKFMNVKPSRFGSWQNLLALYEWAQQEAVALYGGGQFELGIGRQQAQALASLFHPQSDNDISPVLFHYTAPQAGLPIDHVLPDELTATHYLFSDS